MKFKSLVTFAALLASGLAPVAAQEVQVKQAWVRASVPGQKATGAFMTLTARDAAKLVGVSSPVAGIAEVHEMKMQGDVMTMRAVAVLELPAGQAVALKPGGYHLMLMDLSAPLLKGSTVALTLVLQDAKGGQRRLELKVPVAAAAPGAMPVGMPAMEMHRH